MFPNTSMFHAVHFRQSVIESRYSAVIYYLHCYIGMIQDRLQNEVISEIAFSFTPFIPSPIIPETFAPV